VDGVIFGRPLTVPARDLKQLRLVHARARKFESRAARGPNFKKNPVVLS
jgi:hypothetical protein